MKQLNLVYFKDLNLSNCHNSNVINSLLNAFRFKKNNNLDLTPLGNCFGKTRPV